MNYTNYGYRINQVSSGAGFNWIFLPGGPGLGSEYLIEFCQKLKLPGNIFVIDFPMDGTNKNGKLDFQHWREGLIDLLKTFDNPVLVTHSFSGMFVLNMPEIESYLTGLVLMNTTTMNSFFQHVSAMQKQHNLPDLVPAASVYHLNPTDETYREFWHTYKHYCFTAEEMPLGEEMIKIFAFNNAAYHYAIQYFYAGYEARLFPAVVPTMILTSENDYVCPPQIFSSDQKFQTKNVLHKLILQAGHCPWVNHFAEVQNCFDQFVEKLNGLPRRKERSLQ